jgi:hypothetical protein
MNLSDIRFPRQLEVDDTAETIRRVMMACTLKLWPGGDLDAAIITMSVLRGAGKKVKNSNGMIGRSQTIPFHISKL